MRRCFTCHNIRGEESSVWVLVYGVKEMQRLLSPSSSGLKIRNEVIKVQEKPKKPVMHRSKKLVIIFCNYFC